MAAPRPSKPIETSTSERGAASERERTTYSLASLRRFYRFASDRLVAVHDDVDLAVGRIRIRKGGSGGGNRGIASMMPFRLFRIPSISSRGRLQLSVEKAQRVKYLMPI